MQGSPFEVDCSHLVGCDGARSSVRRAAGIQMEGPVALQHLVNIHFFCPDLWQHISQRPAMLYFVFNSDVVSVLVGHDLPNGELVAQVLACLLPPVCCYSRLGAGTNGIIHLLTVHHCTYELRETYCTCVRRPPPPLPLLHSGT